MEWRRLPEDPKPDLEQRASNALSAVMCVLLGAGVVSFALYELIEKLRVAHSPTDVVYALTDAAVGGMGVWLIRVGIQLFHRGAIGPELTGRRE